MVVSLEENEELESNENDINSFFKFTTNFYHIDLDPIEFGKDKILHIENFYYDIVDDLFFKAIHLKKGFTIFTWILPNDFFIIGLYKLSYSSWGYPIAHINDIKIELSYVDDILSDFIKINDIKIVFICTSAYLEKYFDTRDTILSRRNLQKESILNIIIVDIQSDYTGFNQYNIYHALIEDYIPTMQISGYFYNDYLLFTSTAISAEEICNYDDMNYLSIFMIFGYPNGTDNIIDISDYLYFGDDSSIGGYSLYNYLSYYLVIENNIFDYESDNRIKLVSIPDELIIIQMYGRYNDYEGDQLQNNSEIFKSNTYRIKQNTSLIKTSKYYYIDYHYIVKEKDESGKRRINSEEQKFYYGRINRLQFKLCHEYCESCYELGIFDDMQNCTSCLPEYQYNYLSYLYNGHYYAENEINCIKEGYFFDAYDNNVTLCNETNSRYYINSTDNKKICFDNYYRCPS